MRQRAKPVVKNLQLAKNHAKRKIRDMKDKMTQKDAEEEESPYRTGSPTSTKSLSPRRLKKREQHNTKSPPLLSLSYPDGYNNNDDTASRVSSEDSGGVPSYNEDSEDSELESDCGQKGQMNLLEEILDSLSTSHIEQGRLSAAKSLDFFRSIEDLDFVPTKRCKSPSASSSIQVGCELGNGDQGEWNMGQDDSAVNGKHLPPSPRRQPSSRSLPIHPPLTNEEFCELPLRNSFPEVPAVLLSEPSDVDTTSSPTLNLNTQLTPDRQHPTGCSLSRQRVFSKKNQRPYQDNSQQRTAGSSSRQPSMLIPWEMEKGQHAGDAGEVEQDEEIEEKGLLEEIESMCRLSMAIPSDLELTQVQKNTSLD